MIRNWTLLSSGRTIARPRLKFAGQHAEGPDVWKKASAMEVDRVTQMGGVGRHEVVAWPRAGVRRRKFVEDVEDLDGEDLEGSAEAADEEEREDGHDGALDVMA